MRLLGGRRAEASVDLLAWAKTVAEAARQSAFVQAVGRHKHRHFSSAYFLIFTCNTQQGKQTTRRNNSGSAFLAAQTGSNNTSNYRNGSRDTNNE